MTHKAFIAGCSGQSLTETERAFFAAERPWGFIVFARNIDNPDQVTRLSAQLRESVDNEHAPILIDQEGGRVQRLRPPHWTDYPAAAQLGAIFNNSPDTAMRAIWLMSRLHAFDLLPLGINVDCLPVLDVPSPGMHDVIGNRAYGPTPHHVATMGQAACDGLKAGGVLPVIKHIPGHGRATADSHLDLPQVDASLQELEAVDFPPFAALASEPMAMTAHIVYSALDPVAPATTSKVVIDEIIRGKLGFDGLLMSDDVSMKALAGSFADRTAQIFDAGCDVVLHCNGDMDEMQAVASKTPELAGKALDRTNAALAATDGVDDSDEKQVREEFAAILAKLPVS